MLDALRDFIARVKTSLGGKGNAQTEELERAAALWQRALETSAQNAGAEGDGQARYSIEYDRENRPFVSVEEDILEGVPQSDWVRTVKDNLRKKFPNGVTVGNNEIKINAKSRNEIVGSRYSQYLRDFEPELYADKLRSTNNVDEILQASRDYIGEGLNHPRNDNIREFSRGTVQLRIGGNDYTADVVVGTTAQNQLVLYDLLNLQKTSINGKQARTLAAPEADGLHQRTSSPSEDTLPQSSQTVNTQQHDRSRPTVQVPQTGDTYSLVEPAPETTLPEPTQEVNTPRTFSDEVSRQIQGETTSTEERQASVSPPERTRISCGRWTRCAARTSACGSR